MNGNVKFKPTLKIIFVVRVQKENPALALVTNNDKAKGTNKED